MPQPCATRPHTSACAAAGRWHTAAPRRQCDQMRLPPNSAPGQEEELQPDAQPHEHVSTPCPRCSRSTASAARQSAQPGAVSGQCSRARAHARGRARAFLGSADSSSLGCTPRPSLPASSRMGLAEPPCTDSGGGSCCSRSLSTSSRSSVPCAPPRAQIRPPEGLCLDPTLPYPGASAAAAAAAALRPAPPPNPPGGARAQSARPQPHSREARAGARLCGNAGKLDHSAPKPPRPPTSSRSRLPTLAPHS